MPSETNVKKLDFLAEREIIKAQIQAKADAENITGNQTPVSVEQPSPQPSSEQ